MVVPARHHTRKGTHMSKKGQGLRPVSMNIQVGRTDYEDEVFSPDNWCATFFDESAEEFGEVGEFMGTRDVIHKMDLYYGLAEKDKEEIWNRMLGHLRVLYGEDFEPKFPHQK